MNIGGYINAGRARPLAGGRAFIRGVFCLNTPCIGRKRNNVFWTNALAGSAAGTKVRINHGQIIGPHGEGAKEAGPYTGSQAQTSDGTDFCAAI